MILLLLFNSAVKHHGAGRNWSRADWPALENHQSAQGISFTGNLCRRQSAGLVRQNLGTVTFCDIQPRSASAPPATTTVTHRYPCALDRNSWIGIRK